MVSCQNPKNPERAAELVRQIHIVFDELLGQGEKAHALRAQGKKVIGVRHAVPGLEADRSFARRNSRKPGQQHSL